VRTGRQRPWRFSLPIGVADPYFMGQLALELHMPVRELGERMSNYELNVFWPAFFAERHRLREIEDAQRQREADMQRRSL
jgi:hypothetical protein